jgi:hypothetical protein
LITQNTLFILGAGASVPYGYPTANELRRFIITEFKEKYSAYLQDALKMSKDEVIHQANAYSLLIQSFKQSGTNSFDLFLSRNEKRFYDQGKYILAWCLLYFESKSKFNEDIDKPDTDWYKLLYNELTNEITKSVDLEKFAENNLSVITFNYDRSFEQYLFDSLFFSFFGDRTDAIKVSDWIKVVHTYGKLFNLQWEDQHEGVKYSTNELLGLAHVAQNNIKIIYEDRKGQISKIQNIIKSAERIFFLGFGYAKENLEALGFSHLLNRSQRVYGTALGLTDQERIKIKDSILKANPEFSEYQLAIEDLDNVGLLKKYL